MFEKFTDLHTWRLNDGNDIGVRRFEIDELTEVFRGFDAPVLHIGSRATLLDREGGKWRRLYEGREFVGIDISKGDNVDFVFDITGNISQLRRKIGIRQFPTIICPHVLEHVKNPFHVASNITKLLSANGLAIISAPWVQGFHEFPDDYWRFSFSGLRELFGTLDFEFEYYSDAREEYGYQLTFNGSAEHSVRTCRIERNLFQFTVKEMPGQRMFDDREGEKIQVSSMYMPGLSVNVVARKK